MTSWQKVIKYLAMAFAIFLVVSIVSGIIGVLGMMSFFEKDSVSDKTENINISEKVEELFVDIRTAELKIKTGEEFTLESNLNNLTVKENKTKLIIKENKKWGVNASVKSVVTLTLPASHNFNKAEISSGAGIVTVSGLKADNISFELGAGKVVLSDVISKIETEIDGGAGKLIFENCTFNNFDLDMGVGEVNFSGTITGKSSFDCGIGSLTANLEGSAEDYTVSVEKGLGKITVDGISAKNNDKIGSGKNRLEVSGGIGSVKINFK